MHSTITIEAKVLGQKKPLISDWPIALPEFDPPTLRTLITQVVLEEVNAFRKRQSERRLTHVLTASQIEQSAQHGKVDMSGHDLQQEVEPQEAVATALQAFEDGLYLVFVDGAQQSALDGEVCLAINSRITFVRLVALAGG